MKIVHTVEQLRSLTGAWKRDGLSIGLAPTMGFLHEGHQSLMRAAARDNDRVVASIFVNPLQFDPSEDLDSYPKDRERDLDICSRTEVDLVFMPPVREMYPEPFHTHVDVEHLSKGLCGKSRPGHFRGVCTVVCKLLNISRADRAYFGYKDYQQVAVIRRMVRDLNIPVDIVGCPIVREKDGLAKSSRNAYLGPEERKAALVLSRSLRIARDLAEKGEKDCAVLLAAVRGELEAEPLARVDYVEAVDALDLQPVQTLHDPVLIALAVFIGKSRLLDNLLLE